MAAANTVVLSSSPLQGVLERTPAKLCANMSSSPGLPSPSIFFADKASQLGLGSRGSSIQRDAVAGFASASTILRQSHSYDSSKPAAPSVTTIVSREGLENGKGGQPVQGRRKPKARKEFDADTSKPQKAPERKTSAVKKPLAEIAAAVVIESSPIAVTGKTSSTKIKGPAQTKIKKGKVTKAAGAKPEIKNKLKDMPRIVESADCDPAYERSRPPTEPSEGDGLKDKLPGTPRQKIQQAPVDGTLALGLEDATKRRKDWTPVKNTFDGFVTLENVEATPADGMVTAVEKVPITHFSNLLGDYGFAQVTTKANPKPEIRRSSSGEALTKRRKLELVATNLGPSPGTAKPKRSKSPTKKPQTVTAKATEQFIPIDDLPTNKILGYFEPRSGTDSEGKIASKEIMGNDKRAGKKAPAKAKAAKGKAAKATQRASLLLPEAALDKVKDQNLLFGTSSQLVRDESPTFLRETQQAIKESELTDETSIAAQEQGPAARTASGSSNGSSLSLFTTSRNLWSVAARDLKGAVQEAEVVDLSVTPKAQAPLKTAGPATEPTRFAPQAVQDVLSNPRKPDHEWTCIDDEPGMAIVEGSNTTRPPLISREGTVDAELSIPRSLAEASLRERPRSRSPIKKVKAPKAAKELKASKPSKKASQSKEPQEPDEPHVQGRPQGMPNYRGFTTADLNKLVTSYGFKAIKRRDEQIKLLEQCWESKHRIALQALPPNVNLPQPAEKIDVAPEPHKPDSPIKKRGRPPKAKTLTTSKENEISIDNDNTTPKPRGRPSKAKLPKASEQLDDPMDKSARPQKSKTRPTNPTASTASPGKTPKASLPTTRKSPPPPVDHLPNSHTTPTHCPPSPTLDLTPSFDTTLTPLNHAALLAKITEAITTYPPSHDMKRLTWHEKILLYEPIVLEDLATWLNREGLGRVGVDDEVGPGVVKEWCEGRSVCCLWRENLRGGARARY